MNSSDATPSDPGREITLDTRLQSEASRPAGRVAKIYAQSLLAVAEQRGQADEVGDELYAILTDLFKDKPEVRMFFQSSAIHRRRKDELLAELFDGRATPLLTDFLRLLNRNGRLELIRLIAVAYNDLRDERADRTRVLVESAVPLSEAQLDALRTTLSGILDKTAVLVSRVNPELIGG